MKPPKAPAPPDPATQIKAESEANRYDINGPGGSQTWSTGPDGRATQNVQLGPSEQRQYDSQNRIAEAMLGHGADFAQDGPGDFAQLPDFGKRIGGMGDFDLQAESGPQAKAEYARQMAFLEPDFERSNRRFEQDSANAGIPVGSEAYNDKFSQLNRDQNFAREQAARGATTMGAGLALQERGQQFGEAAAGDTQAGAQRGQVYGEDMGRRQQMYNELAAALGSDQIGPVGAYGEAGMPLDVGGAYNTYNQATTNQYNQRAAGRNNMLGGLFSLGSSAIASRGG